MTQQEKLTKELAELNRMLELSRTQPEAVEKIDALEGRFRSALTVRARWHKERDEARGREEQLRTVLDKLPTVIAEREVAFERFALVGSDITTGALEALHHYEQQTAALRVLHKSADARMGTAKAKSRRAALYYEEAEILARSLADQINSAKRDLSRLISADHLSSFTPGQELHELQWLKATAEVPKLDASLVETLLRN